MPTLGRSPSAEQSTHLRPPTRPIFHRMESNDKPRPPPPLLLHFAPSVPGSLLLVDVVRNLSDEEAGVEGVWDLGVGLQPGLRAKTEVGAGLHHVGLRGVGHRAVVAGAVQGQGVAAVGEEQRGPKLHPSQQRALQRQGALEHPVPGASLVLTHSPLGVVDDDLLLGVGVREECDVRDLQRVLNHELEHHPVAARRDLQQGAVQERPQPPPAGLHQLGHHEEVRLRAQRTELPLVVPSQINVAILHQVFHHQHRPLGVPLDEVAAIRVWRCKLPTEQSPQELAAGRTPCRKLNPGPTDVQPNPLGRLRGPCLDLRLQQHQLFPFGLELGALAVQQL
eukprot:RCo016324